MLLGTCQFSGCDAGAAATVGIVPLCALHESYVLELMDRGVARTAEDEAIMSDVWSRFSVGELGT